MFKVIEDRGCFVEYEVASFENYDEAEAKAYELADKAVELDLRNGNGDLWGYIVREEV